MAEIKRFPDGIWTEQYPNGSQFSGHLIPPIPHTALTVHQEDMLARYLAGFKTPIAIDAAIHRGELSADFDALALVRFAVAKGWRLSEEGLALARQEGILKSGPPHTEMVKGDFIPWSQAVTRFVDEMNNTITRDAAAGLIRRAREAGDLKSRGHGKGGKNPMEYERASLGAFILRERNKANARDV